MIQETAVDTGRALQESRAYRSGWEDGRFGPRRSFVEHPGLASWTDHDRLAYYRGHREGRRVREMLGVSLLRA